MTKSSTFLRSWIGFSNNFYKDVFHDCYISLEPEKLIHIVLKKEEDNKHEEVFNKLKENKYFMYSKDITSFLCVFTFSIPEDKEDDFDKFVVGQYSKFTDSSKELILMSHENMNNVKNLAIILYPEKKHRDALASSLGAELKSDAEIYSRPDITEELLPESYK